MELNKTIQHYFQQSDLRQVSLGELQQLGQQYPYTGNLQFLLLKKMKEEAHPDFPAQWQKTLLYFQNPYYLDGLLKTYPKETIAAEPVAEPEPVAAPEPVAPPVTKEPPVKEKLVKELTSELADALALAKAIAKSTTAPDAAPANVSEPIEEPLPSLRDKLLQQESPIKIPSLKDLGPVTDDMPSFEPYHTIDYFASQGIKLGMELPKDKLGKQLKSFTEWIRTMKKLPQTVIEEKLLTTGNGEKIEAMAADSIESREILTETMADVLIKQGDKAGAIRIFRKLSLAHPDKSSYFATRIEQLNNRT